MAENVFLFGKRRIQEIEPPTKGRATYRDKKTAGLTLSVTAKGVKSFVLVRRIQGRAARITIGRFPAVTVEQARIEADRLNLEIAKGRDPRISRRQAREEPTFGDLWDYWLPHAQEHKKTWTEDQRLYNKFLAKWKSRRLSAIATADVERLHAKIGKENGKYQANRVLTMICAMFNKAERIGWKGENPTKGVTKFPEKSRDRFLQADELPRLFKALDEETPLFRDFYTLALLTGARRGNLQAMRWDDVNLTVGIWRIPETKNGEAVLVPLVPAAVEILKERWGEADGGEWVFASRGRTGHLVEPKSAWARICKRAKLDNLRLHDLRRTLGSWQASLGASLPIIGKSLGHKDGSTATAIYSRLNVDPVRESVTKATAAMLTAANGKEEGDG